ncbi:MAG: bifunctional folylpolyglutamate synthase/dihydrofolate synthase, partial [Pseudomonadota bacterium]
LVRYNERIRIAGELIPDERLGPLLEEVLDKTQFLRPSFFEATIAATLHEFARTDADATIIEVGLGGRLDATNVFSQPASVGIASLGIDHERFLLAPEHGLPSGGLGRIAFEKAGIRRPECPLVVQSNGEKADSMIRALALADDIPLCLEGDGWSISASTSGYEYQDSNGTIAVPDPTLTGAHQARNAGLAIAMLLHQDAVPVSHAAIKSGILSVKWPARLQRLKEGPLTGARQTWLDGGHNRDAGEAVAEHFDEPLHLVLGMLDNKDPRALLDPLGERVLSLTIVPVPGHDAHPVEAFGEGARAATDLEDALLNIPSDGRPILIAGSLYLAGEALRLNDEIPD